MIERNPFYDPRSAFRLMWNSVPPPLRLSGYLCDPGIRPIQAEAESDRPMTLPIAKHATSTGRREQDEYLTGVASSKGARLLVELKPEPSRRKGRIDATIHQGRDGRFRSLRVEVSPDDSGNRPMQEDRCSILLMEPEALKAFLTESEGELETSGSETDRLVALFRPALLQRFRLGSFIAYLPAAVESFGVRGKAVFEIPLEDGKRSFNQEDLDRVHLIAVFETSPAGEGCHP